MLLVSHYLLFKTAVFFPKDSVVLRINVAWVKNKKELLKILNKLEHSIFLDYPQGRNKPPRPVLSLEETIKIAYKFKNIKYFAVSNVEDPEKIGVIKAKLPAHIEVVPKIETEKGINNLEKIVKKIKTGHVMLDKEDLYIDVHRDSDKFEKLVEEARKKAVKLKINLLELHGVVFLPYKKK